MKFKLIYAALILSMISGIAQAGFPGVMDVAKGVGTGGIDSEGSHSVEQNVVAFLKVAGEVDGLINNSSDVLFKAIATKEDIEAHDRKIKAATEITDPKGRNTALRTVQDEELTALANLDFEAKEKAGTQKIDKHKQQVIGASIYNFKLAILKDQLLMDIGNQWIVSENSNPLTAQKLAPIKEVISSISSRMDNMKKVAGGIKDLGAAVNLDNLPTSASDSPMSTTVD